LVRRDGDARYLCLDIRHPKIVLIKQTLEDLAGHVLTDSPWSHTERARGRRTPRVCIAVRNIFVLRVFIETGLPLSLNAVIARISHMTPRSVKYVVGLLHSDGLLTKREGEGYTISARVPLSYLQLVTELAEEASVKDKRFDVPSVPTGRAERGGYTSASDGAPRLFIGDNRLRNLMALAKYGPLTQRELTDVTGVFRNMNESRNVAQFTRSDVVRVWETERGLAAMLDPAYPVALPLYKLLRRLEQQYPVGAFIRRGEPLSPPQPEPWAGDRLALFGSPIPTGILYTIGVLGWTFEGLCCQAVTGYDRVVIKKSLKRLEADGILQGNRDRKPGFNVRVVTIADDFPAKAELMELLQACMRNWPDLAERIKSAYDTLPARTKEHLKRRRLEGRDQWGPAKPGRDSASLRLRKEKFERLTEYRAVASELGYNPTAGELANTNSGLIKRIKKSWGSFRTFCAEHGIVPRFKNEYALAAAMQANKDKPQHRLRKPTAEQELHEARRDCVRVYRKLAQQYGKPPSSREVHLNNATLYFRIRAAFGSFAKFREASGFPRRRTSTLQPSIELRNYCIAEYGKLAERLGFQPNSERLKQDLPNLYTRIRAQWGSFTVFCAELKIEAAGHRRASIGDARERRERCIEEYKGLERRHGYSPASHELQQLTNGLYKRIAKEWGGFAHFRDEML